MSKKRCRDVASFAWLGHSPACTPFESLWPCKSHPCPLSTLVAVSLFQVVLKEYHSEPSRATAETGGKRSLPRLGPFYIPALRGLLSQCI